MGLVVAGVAFAGIDPVVIETVTRDEQVPSHPEHGQTDNQVLASGSDSRVGAWTISAYTSAELRDAGQVAQPAGLRCLNLLLGDASSGAPVAGRGFCGARGRGGLNVAELVITDRAGRDWLVLFGQAPEPAAAVRLRSPDGVQFADVEEIAPYADGDVWFLVTPRPQQAGSASIDWIRPDGIRGGDVQDVTRLLERPVDPLPLGSPGPPA